MIDAFDLAGRDLIGEHHRKGSEAGGRTPTTKPASALLIPTPPAAHRGTAAARTAPGTPSSGDDAANAGAPRLRRALAIQKTERMALGPDYGPGEHVVCDEAGRRYHPDTISDYWRAKNQLQIGGELRKT
ncbi:MAG: hypothetical protein ACLPYO_28640 [Mycobacterium sp.]